MSESYITLALNEAKATNTCVSQNLLAKHFDKCIAQMLHPGKKHCISCINDIQLIAVRRTAITEYHFCNLQHNTNNHSAQNYLI